MDKKEVVAFRQVISAGTSDMFLSERIKGDGTIEGVRIRFYEGANVKLQVRPFVEHRGGTIEDLLTYPEGTDPFISGNDDYFQMPVVIPVRNDDYIKLQINNIHEIALNLSVDIIVDYYEGQNRIVGGVF